jgi:hypothetical protein
MDRAIYLRLLPGILSDYVDESLPAFVRGPGRPRIHSAETSTTNAQGIARCDFPVNPSALSRRRASSSDPRRRCDATSADKPVFLEAQTRPTTDDADKEPGQKTDQGIRREWS